MTAIRAAVLHAVDTPLKIETLTLASPGPHEVQVRMHVAGICHSDLHVIKGELRQSLPVVLGHEGSGVVEAVGDDVHNIQPGARVALSWVPGCGECFYCQNHQAHLCDRGDPLANDSRLSLNGQPVYHFLSTSAFAESVVVPAGGVVPIPDDVSLETAALISCGVATGIGAVFNAAHVHLGAAVAVFGCGGVGLNIIQGARLAGAGLIAAVDQVPAKLQTATGFGATHTIDAAKPDLDVVKTLRGLTEGRGVDYAFEAIGHTRILQTALNSTRKGGIVVAVGLPPIDQRLDVRGLSLVLQEKSIIGSLYGSMSPADQIPQLLGLYQERKLMLDELISHRFTLDQINDAFDMLQRGEMNRGLIVFEAARGSR